MTIRQQELPNGTWLIRVYGRLDQNLNPQLEKNLTSLLDEGNNHFIINLQETTYINSGGLRCLVSAWRKARQREGNLVLCGLNTRLHEIFSMVGFDKVFQIYPTCDAALQASRAQT
jgi:anti-sigma B factor antagonist